MTRLPQEGPLHPRPRPRRLRATPALRRLVAETRLHPAELILPVFVREGAGDPVPISSMPGVVQHTTDSLKKAVTDAAAAGIGGIMLFGVPEHKDAIGSGATDPEGILNVATRIAVAEAGDALVVQTDLCLDEFTDHGHCGVLAADGSVDNDATLLRYREMALAQAEAGSRMLGLSGMMDGQVAAVRDALDAAGHANVPLLGYAAKYASAFYGPFREAVQSSLEGDRRTYQLDPANRREGAREGRWVLLDFVDLVAHIQHAEERGFYGLDRLWKDCPTIDFPEARVEGPDEPTNLAELQMPAGMRGGRRLFEDFAARIDRYKRARDFPAVKGVSYLSTHLRFGTVSIRQLAAHARAHSGEGAETWLSELIWRDFYHQILANFPHVVSNAFRPEYDKVRFEHGKHAQTLFAAWCEGRTGYPLVDAAMAQINQTGYMHNRLRMVVASFLVKDLGIDWRWGERYFAEKLIDFDLAANNGGWQWAASTGCDAQPWFRIFNPVTQSEKFDPQGKFIRRYLPQLAGLSDAAIHAPWKAPELELVAADVRLGQTYPNPIVDHAIARERTLERYAVVKRCP